jgi:hypothetical protein
MKKLLSAVLLAVAMLALRARPFHPDEEINIHITGSAPRW